MYLFQSFSANDQCELLSWRQIEDVPKCMVTLLNGIMINSNFNSLKTLYTYLKLGNSVEILSSSSEQKFIEFKKIKKIDLRKVEKFPQWSWIEFDVIFSISSLEELIFSSYPKYPGKNITPSFFNSLVNLKFLSLPSEYNHLIEDIKAVHPNPSLQISVSSD